MAHDELERVIAFAKAQLRGARSEYEKGNRRDPLLERRIRTYEQFLESQGVEVEKQE